MTATFRFRLIGVVERRDLVSLYLALKHSDVFGRVAVVSPSAWFANKQIVHYVEALPKKPNVRIWIDMGTKEGRNSEDAQQAVTDARLLQETLIKKGWQPGRDLNYFESILTFLFPRKM